MLNIKFNNIYVASYATVAGKKEGEGPLKDLFDKIKDKRQSKMTSFEEEELKMKQESIDICLEKINKSYDDVDVFISGDLNNQIACSSKVSGNIDTSFIGIYGACSTSALGWILGACLLQGGFITNALISSTSSYATSERQFRNPIEYGGPKRFTTTYTVTGSGSIILNKNRNVIKLSSATIGKTYDPSWNDVSDLGIGMSYAAYKTIKEHLNYFGYKHDYYDAIITGDLSSAGSKVLIDIFAKDGIVLDNHYDCGKMIYDIDKQQVFMGGSGVACAPLVTYTKVFKNILSGVWNKVLIVPTGALFDPTYVFQKKTIPVIAHAVSFERSL